jgi:hypothetical protein
MYMAPWSEIKTLETWTKGPQYTIVISDLEYYCIVLVLVYSLNISSTIIFHIRDIWEEMSVQK